jgi:ABC-type branched-subunit amino acid transport system substrate-binding protein
MFRRRAAVKSAVWVMAAVAAILTASDRIQAETPSGAPITIGFSMPLTGGLAVNGTSGLLAMQIWAEDTNKKGGLLGRRSSSFITMTRPTRPWCPGSTQSCSMSTR